MFTTVTTSSSKANSDYLMTALNPIYQALINYLKLQQQEEVEEQPLDITPELKALAASMSSVPHLEKLCQTFALSTFERNILLLCICRTVFPDVPYCLTQAQGNPRASYPTFSLTLRMWSDNDWSATHATSPLRRWQLLLLKTNLEDITLTPLRVDEAILQYLMGKEYHDPQLSDILQPLTTVEFNLAPSHQQIATSIINIWSTLFTQTTLPIVQLCGYSISTSEEIAAAVCYRYSSPLYYLAAAHLPSNPRELLHLVQRWHRQVRLVGGVLLLDCHNLSQADLATEKALAQLVAEVETPIIICTETRRNWPRRQAIAFDVPSLTYAEQLELWQSNLGEVAAELNGTVESLVTNFNLSGATIKTACATVAQQQEEKNGHQQQQLSLGEQLWQFCRTQARPQLDDLAQRVESQATWEDLILPEKTKTLLQELASQVRQRGKVYQQWGLGKVSGRGLGVSALFAGDSGTGKTLAAEVLANEFNLDLYRIDLSSVVSKYIGETEKNLERIFSTAEGGGVVLLFDEADALFGKRTQVKDSHDRHANVEVSFLLQRMEAYQGLALLTTNLKDSLDQAFLRRLRFMISFPFPDAKSRSQIWQRMYTKAIPTQGLNYRQLGQLAMAGGNIRNISLNAAFLAADAGEAVMMKHILAAAKAEATKLGRLIATQETAGWVLKF